MDYLTILRYMQAGSYIVDKTLWKVDGQFHAEIPDDIFTILCDNDYINSRNMITQKGLLELVHKSKQRESLVKSKLTVFLNDVHKG